MPPSAVALQHKTLENIDIGIIVVYFILIFGIGYYFARRERTSEEYFLAGRNIGWFAIGASLFVSNISTEHFIGLAGSGATSGLAVGHFEWLACLMLLLLGWVFVPFYLRSNVFTMPEFLERRFNRNCATYLASISVIAYIFTKISVHLYGAGDRSARSLRYGRRPRLSGHYLRRISVNSPGLRARPARADRLGLVSGVVPRGGWENHQRRHCLPDHDRELASTRAGGINDRRATCCANGGDELGLQFRIHDGDARFLQEVPPGGDRISIGIFRTDRYGG